MSQWKQGLWCLGMSATVAFAAPGDTHADPNSARADEECKPIEPALTRETGLGTTHLNWFISSQDEYVYYIGGGNHIMKLGADSGVGVPGWCDPVPTPDGRFMSTPSTMSFYSGAEMRARLERGEDASDMPAVLEDNDLSGVYQSVGVTQRNDEQRTYRVITDTAGLSFRDYSSSGPENLVPTGPVQGMCSRLQRSQRQLPMISKDGRYLAAYDTETRTTKIYDVGADGLNCEMLVDLGIAAGKVDFEPTNDRITFHMDFFNFQTGYFSGVDDGMTKDAFVMKLTKDATGRPNGVSSIARLSTATKKGSGTYYPRWTGTNRVVASRDKEDTYSLVEFNPDQPEYVPYWSPTQATPPTKGDHARYALSSLWSKVCGRHSPDSQFTLPENEARWFALSLSRTACQRLVHSYWEARKAEVRETLHGVQGLINTVTDEVDENDLLAACPATDTENDVERRGSLAVSTATPAELFESKCADCHRGGYVDPDTNHPAPELDFANLPLDQVRSSRRMINARSARSRMPPSYAGQLNDAEKQALTQFLNAREEELTR